MKEIKLLKIRLMKSWGKKMKDSIIKVFLSTGRNCKTTVKNQVETKLWNIK